jgi:hypothetical protein
MSKYTIHDIMYSSGDVFLPEYLKKFLAIDLIGNHTKTFYISNWSIVHLLSGILIGYIFIYFNFSKDGNLTNKEYYLKMFSLHTIWEMWQIFIGMSHPLNLSGQSNIIDTIMDTILFMVGAWCIRILKK